MKLRIAILFLALNSLTAIANDIPPAPSASNPILIKGGTLHTVTQGTLKNTDIYIENGKIIRIQSDMAIPKNAQVINASGKHIYPSLIGLVTQIGLVEIGSLRATRDSSEVGGYTPEVQAHIAYNADSEVIPTIRSNGISHVQISPSGGRISGQSSVMQLDAWHWKDALVKPRTAVHMAWPSSGINKAFWESRTPEKQKEAQDKQRKEFKETFDAIRAYHTARSHNNQSAIDLRWEAMRGVLTKEKPLFIYANDSRQIQEAIHFAQAENINIVLVGARDAALVVDLIKSSNTPVIFTHAWGRPARAEGGVDEAFSTPAVLEKNGINYALAINGSWNVRDLPFAAGQSIAYGVSKESALKSVTLTPAKLLGLEKELGSLEPGKDASLVISEGDIFNHLTHQVTHLFIQGREVDLDNRHKRLYKKYSKK